MSEFLASITGLPGLVGAIALALSVFVLLQQSNKHLLAALSLSLCLWAIHYGLLGAVAGAIIHAFAALGLAAAHILQNHQSRSRALAAVTTGLAGTALMGALWQGWTDMLALAGYWTFVVSQYLGRGLHLRLGFMAGEAIYFGYAIIVGSIPGALVCAANIAAGVIGLLRMARYERTAQPGTG